MDLVTDRLTQEDCSNGYILDGFPRTIPRAQALDTALIKIGDFIDFALNVDVPDPFIIERMAGRRACPGLWCNVSF